MTTAIDPVGAGLVASLARPGATSPARFSIGELSTKRLELFKDVVPGLSRGGPLESGESAKCVGVEGGQRRPRPWA